jgi:hypothetical protein
MASFSLVDAAGTSSFAGGDRVPPGFDEKLAGIDAELTVALLQRPPGTEQTAAVMQQQVL